MKEPFPSSKHCAIRRRAPSGPRPTSASASPTGPRGQGALVTSVDPGTPAEQAGIEQDDLVVAVDGAEIDGSTGLIAAIRDLEPGDSTQITIVRDGEQQTFDVTLTARPPPRRLIPVAPPSSFASGFLRTGPQKS